MEGGGLLALLVIIVCVGYLYLDNDKEKEKLRAAEEAEAMDDIQKKIHLQLRRNGELLYTIKNTLIVIAIILIYLVFRVFG